MSAFESLDHYCERLDASFWSEPVNALTNFAFIIAAFVACRLFVRHYPDSATMPRDIALLPILIFIIGVGSFLFHSVATRWAMWADVVPILLFQLATIVVLVRRLIAPRWWAVVLAWGAFIVAGAGIEFALRDVSTYGSAGYIAPWLVILMVAIFLRHRHPPAARAFADAAVLFVLSLIFRTLDTPLCEGFPLGTHFLWHCLNAVVLFRVFKGSLLLASPTNEIRHG
jgi:hypothetical protein